MPSPVLNEKVMKGASTTWAPPTSSSDHFPPVSDRSAGAGPVSDGPVSPWKAPRVMTVNGAISATAVLFVLFLTTATIGWMQTDTVEVGEASFVATIPSLAWVGMFVGIGLTFLLMFKPHLAKFIGPIYALAQGFFVGAISKAYETSYDGIVVMAAGATIAVFAVMLVLYRTRIIKVTDRFRRTIITATIGIMVFYGITFLIRLGFSFLVAGIAAMNLALDFDFIERGAEQRLDKDFEWYAAFGLLVTIIWLYLEILRLLSKLRER
jgi:uncharacterized YccA/Bax inhibitor family protein